MPRLRRCALGLVALGLGAWSVASPAGAGSAEVDDPIFVQGLQWGLEQISAPQAWSTATGEGVTIAVVDSGVDLEHEDLVDKVVDEISCIGSNGDPSACRGSAQDDHGHGTHAAGVALASTNNGIGMAGVAPDADLMAVRVLRNECDEAGTTCQASGTSEDVAAGIRWAVDQGADVINLSLGGEALESGSGCPICEAIEYAWAEGAIPVMAAGNEAVLPDGFADEPVVIVTATTRHAIRTTYSNASTDIVGSARWPIAAPGGEAEKDPDDCATGGSPRGVISTYWVKGDQNSYACLAGTSMATAHASGALAVLLSTGLSPQEAIDRLLGTAEDLGPAGPDDLFGVGLINLAAAVDPDVETTTTTTTPSVAAPPTDAPPAPYLGETSTETDLSTWTVAFSLLGLAVIAGGSALVGWKLTRPRAAR